MSNEMQQVQADYLEARDARHVGRVVSKHQAAGQIRTSAVDIETDVALAKVDALTQATGYGMRAVSRVAQAQVHLEQLSPQASARLNYLADEHVLAVSDVLANLRSDLHGK